MKIGVIAANGKAGSLIVKEAVNRDLDVTAIARRENRTVADKFLEKDIFDLKPTDVSEFDVLIDAFGAKSDDHVDEHETTLKHLADIIANTSTRLFVVGGAGSLYVDEAHQETLSDGTDFPDAFKPTANAMAAALTELRKRDDVNWTYVSPAAEFEADAERTGEYILAGEEFTVNNDGDSMISYADYAIAMIDLVLADNHNQERVSVLGK